MAEAKWTYDGAALKVLGITIARVHNDPSLPQLVAAANDTESLRETIARCDREMEGWISRTVEAEADAESARAEVSRLQRAIDEHNEDCPLHVEQQHDIDGMPVAGAALSGEGQPTAQAKLDEHHRGMGTTEATCLYCRPAEPYTEAEAGAGVSGEGEKP
jgi:hypothetical protein